MWALVSLIWNAAFWKLCITEAEEFWTAISFLWNKRERVKKKVRPCKGENILVATLSSLQDFLLNFFLPSKGLLKLSDTVFMVYSAVTTAFVCWEIHKGKYMPVSRNKLAGKKNGWVFMNSCGFPSHSPKDKEKQVITPALPHVGQAKNTHRSGLRKP